MKGKKIFAVVMAFAVTVCMTRGGFLKNGGSVYAQQQMIPVSAISGQDETLDDAGSVQTDIDDFTIMLYMCGTDLETDYGAATADILEMCNANISDTVNVVLYTGGTLKWQNDVISPEKNQIWQIVHDNMVCVEDDMGRQSMTNPNTLTKFVKYCGKNFPAKRNALILWDHGGGALYGYGSDQKFENDAMRIDEIDKALTKAGMTFDFIGFDACLMATVETACMAARHADYMIASEETEPGCGWYYTGWLNKVCKDTSISTKTIGKRIVKDFVNKCVKANPEEQCTLSLIKLSKINNVYSKLCKFSANAKKQLDKKNFQAVARCVSNTKAFGDDGYDTIDLMHFAQNTNIKGAKELIGAVGKAVVYSQSSPSIQNANGMTVYLPYNDIRSFDKMLTVYKGIGLEGEYLKFVKAFASIVAGGQSMIGSNTPVDALNGQSGQDGQADFGDWTDYSWFDEDYVSGYAQNYGENSCDTQELAIEKRGDSYALALSDQSWEVINDVEMQLFYDDGEGYIDLGMDNYFETDKDGALKVDYDGLWFSLGGHLVSLYVSKTDEGTKGYIPCELNGEAVNLVVSWDEEGKGHVEGALRTYDNGMSMKGLLPVKKGDTIQPLCDYYAYDGTFSDKYYFGKPFKFKSKTTVDYVASGEGQYLIYYVITDIYNNTYYTEPVTLTFGK